MLIAVSGRRARAYIYAHRAQRVNVAIYCSLAKKGPWVVHITVCSDKGVGGYL